MYLACLILNFVKIDPKTKKFLLDDGREIVFHGMNAVAKVFPYFPNNTGKWDFEFSMIDEDVEFYRNHSFNVIRLGIMWPGVMPEMGVVNQTYLEEAEKLINKFGEKGIYTQVDFHQDLLSEYSCGEGIPRWVSNYTRTGILPFARPLFDEYPRQDDHTIDLEKCLEVTFGVYYGTPFVGDLFDCLYDPTCNHFCDKDGANCTSKVVMQDHFVDYWVTIAKFFADNQYVMGYDLINEPTAGNPFRHPIDYVNTPKFEREVLQPFYQRIMKAVYEVDKNHIIFFEPLVTALLPAGFDVGGPGLAVGIPSELQGFAWHVYCWTIDENGDPIQPKILCDASDTFIYETHHRSGIKLGLANFVDEFGATPDSDLSRDSLQVQLSLFSKDGHSWAYWQYKPFGDITTCFDSMSDRNEGLFNRNGSLQYEKVKLLAHPYASIISGHISANRFDFENQSLNLRFTTGKVNEETFIGIAPEWKGFGKNYSFRTGADAVFIIVQADSIIITTLTKGVEVDVDFNF